MSARAARVARFAAGAFLPSWALAGTFFLLARGAHAPPPMVVVGVLFMLFPAASAIGVLKLVERAPVREALALTLRPSRWFVLAWLAPVVLTALAGAASLLVPGVSFAPDLSGFFERAAATATPEQLAQMRRDAAALPVHPALLSLGQALLAGGTVNAVVALGEELGWRGWLYRELAPTGFFRTSLATGLLWGVWHAPLVLQGHDYPAHPVAGVVMITLFCVLASPLYTYVRARSGSVVPAAILHGSINATAGLPLLLLRGGDDLTLGLFGVPGLVVLLLADVAVVLWDLRVAKSGVVAPRAAP